MAILFIILYLLIGIVAAGIGRRIGALDRDDPFTVAVIGVWPLLIVCFIIALFAQAIDALVEFIGGK